MAVQTGGDPWKGEHFGPNGAIARKRRDLEMLTRAGRRMEGLLPLASALYGGATRRMRQGGIIAFIRGVFLLREAGRLVYAWRIRVDLPQTSSEELDVASTIFLRSARVSPLLRNTLIALGFECARVALRRPDLKPHPEALLHVILGELRISHTKITNYKLHITK